MESIRPAAEGPVGRRTVLTATLAAAVAAPLAACTGDDETPDAGGPTTTITPAATTAPPEGDVALAAEALGHEQALLGYCTKATTRRPAALRRELVPVRERQRAIVAALTETISATAAPRHPPIAVPGQDRAMLRKLTALLAAAEEDRRADCLAAESGLLARLLASVSASHAVAVEQVRALR